MKIAKIRSSGFEGTEKAALDAAKKMKIMIVGWIPKEYPAAYEELKETKSSKKEQSTIWNVRDSHATLIIGPIENFMHLNLALEVADSYGRPVCVSDNKKQIMAWLSKLGEELTLNVIGPSEEEIEGAYFSTRKLITDILKDMQI